MQRANKADKTAAPMPARLKMKQVEQLTGVGRETIRFYIHEGLVPEPQRAGRNVAYYDDAFVDRVRLIKALQQKRFLPLRVIKSIVDGESVLAPGDVEGLLQLDRHLLHAAGIDLRRPPLRLAEVARRTGLPPSEIRRLAGVEAIEIAEGGLLGDGRGEWLHDSDVMIVEVWAKMRQAGFTEALGFEVEDLRLFVDTVRWMVPESVPLFTRRLAGKIDPEQFAAMAEIGIDLLNQLLGVLHRSLVMRHIAQASGSPMSVVLRGERRRRRTPEGVKRMNGKSGYSLEGSLDPQEGET